MVRDQIRGDVHDQMVFDMESPGERDAWMRVFPDLVPDGYQLVHQWGMSGNKVRLVLKLVKVGSGATADGKPAGAEAELLRLTNAELVTRGAELGLSFTNKHTRANMSAEIAKKLASPAQPAKE